MNPSRCIWPRFPTIFGLFPPSLVVAGAAIGALLACGCGSDGTQTVDCRNPEAACLPGYECVQVSVQAWACQALVEPDSSGDVADSADSTADAAVDGGDSSDAPDGQDALDVQDGEPGSDADADAEDSVGGDADADMETSVDVDIDVLNADGVADGAADAGDTADADVDVDPGPEPLSVALSVPTSILSGAVVIVATPSGGAPLLGAEFLVDGQSIHTDIIPPYTAYLDTVVLGDGPHNLIAQVADQAGQVAEDSRQVVFDNAPPLFELWTPEAESTVFFEDGPLRVDAEISDASGVASAEFRANGLLVGELDQPPFSVAVEYEEIFLGEDQLPKGVFVGIQATDLLDQVSQESRTVYVHKRHRWTFDTLGEIWGEAAVFPEGNIVFANDEGKVYAVTPEGAQAWEATASSSVVTSVTVDPESARAFVGTTDGTVHAFGSGGGAAWSKNPASSPIAGKPALGEGWVAVTTFTGGVYALQISNGATVWSATLPGNITAGPAVAADGTAYVGCHNGALYAVQGGSIQWSALTGDEIWSTPVVGPDERVYFGSNDGWLYAVSADGFSLWEQELKGEIWGRPWLDADGSLYVATTFKRLYRLDTNVGGQVVWEKDLDAGVSYSSPIMDDAGVLYLGTTKGAAPAASLLAIDSETGDRVFAFDFGNTVHATPLLVGNTLYVGSTDRSLVSVWRAGVQLGPPGDDAP